MTSSAAIFVALMGALRTVSGAPAAGPEQQRAEPHHDSTPSSDELTTQPRHIVRNFYLHASVGPGLLFAATDSNDTRHFFGTSAAFQIAVAGEYADGALIGAAYFRDQVLTMSTHDDVLDGDEPTLDDTWFSFDRAGMLLAFLPNPDGGVHIQGFVGWGDLNAHRPDTQEYDDPSGLVFSVAGGYEWFSSDHWRLGGLFRFTFAPLAVDETQQSHTRVTTWLPTLLFSATYY